MASALLRQMRVSLDRYQSSLMCPHRIPYGGLQRRHCKLVQFEAQTYAYDALTAILLLQPRQMVCLSGSKAGSDTYLGKS